jgi:hypothetical protein
MLMLKPVVLAMIAAASLAGCTTDADVASRNLSRAADMHHQRG